MTPAWKYCVLLALGALCGCGSDPFERSEARDDPPLQREPERPVRNSDSPAADSPTSGSDGTGASVPGVRRCPPGKAIGVVATEGDKVYINGAPAKDGDEVCDGDEVHTGADSSAQVLIGDDRESDSVQLDANTDPRFRRLASGCILVDKLRKGRLYSEQKGRRGCLIYEVQGTYYYQSGASVNVRLEPDPRSATQPRLAELTVVRGEVRPLRTTAAQLPQLRLEQLESLKLAPVRLNNQLTVVSSKPTAVQVRPEITRKATEWTTRFKLKPGTLDIKRLQTPKPVQQ